MKYHHYTLCRFKSNSFAYQTIYMFSSEHTSTVFENSRKIWKEGGCCLDVEGHCELLWCVLSCCITCVLMSAYTYIDLHYSPQLNCFNDLICPSSLAPSKKFCSLVCPLSPTPSNHLPSIPCPSENIFLSCLKCPCLPFITGYI